MTRLPEDMAAELGRLDADDLSVVAAEVNAVLVRHPGVGLTGALAVLGGGMLARLRVAGRPDQEAHAVLAVLAECTPTPGRRVQ